MRAKNHSYLHKIIDCKEFVDRSLFPAVVDLSSSSVTDISKQQQQGTLAAGALVRSFKCRCTYFRLNDNCNSGPVAPQYDMSSGGTGLANNLLPTENDPTMTLGGNVYDTDDEAYVNYIEDEEEVINANNKNPNSVKECLVAYMGMAIKGHNLVFKQWVSEDHCLNLCLSTSKRNGLAFDCKSFEHWQTDCSLFQSSPASNETTNVPRLCAASAHQHQGHDKTQVLSHRFHQDAFYANHRHHRQNGEDWHSLSSAGAGMSRSQRAINKIEYCVLSNISRSMAGRDFAENNAVTYYEILCKSKPVFFFNFIGFFVNVETQTKICEFIQKNVGRSPEGKTLQKRN
jgi:hypothetical protein